MWPFKKKNKNRPQVPEIQDSWSLSQGTHEGRPLVVRINRGVDQAVGHPDYAHQIGVAVPLLDPDENGLPTGDDAEQLETIEDLLVDRLTESRQGIFALVISTGGMREFVFYTSDPEAAHRSIEQVDEEVASHEIQHVIENDPKWAVYKRFA